MRKRNIRIQFRLDEDEHEKLMRQLEKSGMKIESFMRRLVNGVDIRPTPPAEYKKIYSLLSNISNNINQIAKQANTKGYIDSDKLDAALILTRKCWQRIKDLR